MFCKAGTVTTLSYCEPDSSVSDARLPSDPPDPRLGNAALTPPLQRPSDGACRASNMFGRGARVGVSGATFSSAAIRPRLPMSSRLDPKGWSEDDEEDDPLPRVLSVPLGYVVGSEP
jgi:hypothetical protein